MAYKAKYSWIMHNKARNVYYDSESASSRIFFSSKLTFLFHFHPQTFNRSLVSLCDSTSAISPNLRETDSYNISV